MSTAPVEAATPFVLCGECDKPAAELVCMACSEAAATKSYEEGHEAAEGEKDDASARVREWSHRQKALCGLTPDVVAVLDLLIADLESGDA